MLPRRRFLVAGGSLILLPHTVRAQSTTVDAAAFGAVSDGKTDATEALNAAARSVPRGGILRLSPGRYYVTSTILLKSGTTIEGQNTTLIAGANWRRIQSPKWWMSPGFALIGNVNFAAAAISDHEIVVRGIRFEYPGLQRGDAHAIRFRKVRGIIVADCGFVGGGDATAFLACVNTEVVRCAAENTLNCAYDHWDGPRNATVRDCSVRSIKGYGILFTGVGTEHEDDEAASNVTAAENVIEISTGTGIWVCSLSQGSSVANVMLKGNTVRIAKGSGIGATGDIRGLTIENNQVEGVRGGNAIFARPDKWHHPIATAIVGNTIVDCETADRGVALIQALGDGVRVEHNQAIGGRYPSLVWVDDPNARLVDNTGSNFTKGQYTRTRRQALFRSR